MTATILRVIAGIMALISLGVVVGRVFMATQDAGTGSGGLMFSLGLMFPLSLAMFLGYLAWKGKLPFGHDSDNSAGPKN